MRAAKHLNTYRSRAAVSPSPFYRRPLSSARAPPPSKIPPPHRSSRRFLPSTPPPTPHQQPYQLVAQLLRRHTLNRRRFCPPSPRRPLTVRTTSRYFSSLLCSCDRVLRVP